RGPRGLQPLLRLLLQHGARSDGPRLHRGAVGRRPVVARPHEPVRGPGTVPRNTAGDDMTSVLVLGAAFGVGVLLIVSGLVPARPPLALALERLHRPA